MVLITMEVTVKLDGEFLVFERDGIEFYDIHKFRYDDYLPFLRIKRWWTDKIENECKSLIDGRG